MSISCATQALLQRRVSRPTGGSISKPRCRSQLQHARIAARKVRSRGTELKPNVSGMFPSVQNRAGSASRSSCIYAVLAVRCPGATSRTCLLPNRRSRPDCSTIYAHSSTMASTTPRLRGGPDRTNPRSARFVINAMRCAQLGRRPDPPLGFSA